MFIPTGVEWFLSDEIEECFIDGKPGSIWVNLVLIRAGSFDEAYDKALAHGKLAETTYENTDGQSVEWKFRGLRDLKPIHDPLEDGCEITFESYDEDSYGTTVRTKEEIWAANASFLEVS